MSSKSTDGTISGLDYAMVVLVIGIVAVSSLYVAWVLLIEVYRSIAFYMASIMLANSLYLIIFSS